MQRLLPVLLCLMVGFPAIAETISGTARIVDAATMEVAGRLVRLHGIHAPARSDRCPFRGREIDCGLVAATALMDLTAGTPVRCTVRGHGDAGTIIATCRAAGYDLSEGMVYTGWARPAMNAPARYALVERSAKARKRGLWQGKFPPAVDALAATP